MAWSTDGRTRNAGGMQEARALSPHRVPESGDVSTSARKRARDSRLRPEFMRWMEWHQAELKVGGLARVAGSLPDNQHELNDVEQKLLDQLLAHRSMLASEMADNLTRPTPEKYVRKLLGSEFGYSDGRGSSGQHWQKAWRIVGSSRYRPLTRASVCAGVWSPTLGPRRRPLRMVVMRKVTMAPLWTLRWCALWTVCHPVRLRG